MDDEDFSLKNYASVENIVAFLDYFLGKKVTTLMCGQSKLYQNKSN